MRYKVGDKVRVRSDLKLSVLYDGLCAIDEMIKKKIVTITYVYDGGYDTVNGCYVQPNYWVLPKVFRFPKDDEI